jgi:pSer/pThr/pTyr-binding forkhead associated (FHA) protein
MNAPRLKWKEADGRFQEYLIANTEVVIGRAGGADLVLSGQHVSRRHAMLRNVSGGFEIQDLESRFGTFVNGERVQHTPLRHGDRIVFGKGEEYYFYIEASEARPEMDTTRVVQKSFHDLGRVLPSAASDLEKILCVLNFQQEWSEVFTPENGLYQILESSLKISGAERAFIMTRKLDDFGYSAGMDGNKRRLSEQQFRASKRVVSSATWQRNVNRYSWLRVSRVTTRNRRASWG